MGFDKGRIEQYIAMINFISDSTTLINLGTCFVVLCEFTIGILEFLGAGCVDKKGIAKAAAKTVKTECF